MYTIITMVCVLPMIWIARVASRSSRAITKSIKATTGKIPERFDIWSVRGIALDLAQGVLVFVHQNKSETLKIVISLQSIVSVQLLVNSKKAPDGRNALQPKDVDLIQLQFTLSDNDVSEHLLTFFDLKEDGPAQVNFHYLLARKWMQTVNGLSKKSIA